MKAYPAPHRYEWIVGVEFLDGSFIGDVDDAAVIDRWQRLSWSFVGTREEFKAKMADHARVFYGVALLGIDGDTDDTEFIDAFADSGVIAVIRKG